MLTPAFVLCAFVLILPFIDVKWLNMGVIVWAFLVGFGTYYLLEVRGMWCCGVCSPAAGYCMRCDMRAACDVT